MLTSDVIEVELNQKVIILYHKSKNARCRNVVDAKRVSTERPA